MASASAAAPLVASPPVEAPRLAHASAPSPVWSDANKLQILCILSGIAPQPEALRARLCQRVRELAAQGAPVPVSTIALGDPALVAADAVTLLVHFSAETVRGETLLAFTARPYRALAGSGDMLFGTPPRAVRLEQTAHADAALGAALADTLEESLPWLAQELSARPET